MYTLKVKPVLNEVQIRWGVPTSREPFELECRKHKTQLWRTFYPTVPDRLNERALISQKHPAVFADYLVVLTNEEREECSREIIQSRRSSPSSSIWQGGPRRAAANPQDLSLQECLSCSFTLVILTHRRAVPYKSTFENKRLIMTAIGRTLFILSIILVFVRKTNVI